MQANAKQEEEDLPPPERVRRLLFSLVIECNPLQSDDIVFILSQLETLEARQQLSEFLQAFTSPRNIDSEEILSTLGSIIRCVLDILWSDRETQTLRELNSIMHASQLLFIFKEENVKVVGSTRSVKLYLSSYINDH